MHLRTAEVSEVASGVTGERVATATSARGVRGVRSSGSLPGLGAAKGLPRSGACSSVDGHKAEDGSRDFRSWRQSVAKFSGKSQNFPLWKEDFEVYTSMVGCMSAFPVDHDIMIGDVTNNTQYILSQGLSEEHIKTAGVAWTCLTESVVNRDLLGRLFATKSPSAGWKMLCDWFMPKTMAEQVKWSVAFYFAKMEKGEEPMKNFSRIDKIVGVLASLGVVKSVADVNRKIIMTLTSDYEIEERTILCREDFTRTEIESII